MRLKAQKKATAIKTQRRVCCGLREVLKLTRVSKVSGIIVAPNIEKIEAQQGLDEYQCFLKFRYGIEFNLQDGAFWRKVSKLFS